MQPVLLIWVAVVGMDFRVYGRAVFMFGGWT